jgi:hypothetical protein
MVRLHGGYDVQLRETIEIFSGHVLSVFDAKTSIAIAVSFHNLGIQVEDDRNAVVTNGMSTNLKAGGIRSHHAVLHQRNRVHFVRQQAAIIWLIAELVEKVRCTRSQGAISIGFEGPNPK